MLKQQTEKTTSGWQHTPPTAQAAPERFDKDAIQNILQTATRLQQAEQDTLSREEIEAMAAEMGISPRHVRQAISLSGRQTGSVNGFRPVRLSAQQLLLAAATTLLYTIANTSLFSYSQTVPTANWAIRLFLMSIFVLPFALSFWLGTQVRFKRTAAACGLFLTFIMFLGMQMVMSLLGHDNLLSHDGWWIVLLITTGAVISGIGGAALEQWRVNRKLSRLPLAVRPSELDR